MQGWAFDLPLKRLESAGGRRSWIDGLLHRHTETCFLMGTAVAMQNAALDRLVDFAEGRIQAGLNSGLGFIARSSGVGITSTEAALHKSAHGGLVSLVLEAVALSDLDALL